MAEPFSTGIVDPDWPYTVAPGMKVLTNGSSKGRLSGYTRNRDEAQNQYTAKRPLSIDEMARLPIGEVVGGYIFLWIVAPFLLMGTHKRLLSAWGFEPMSMVTWAKYDLENKHGYGGVGFWFLGNAEFCVVGKRRGMPSVRTGRSSLFIAPKKRHSEKPDDIHSLCEDRFPGPYIEIFGRRERKGWVVLGNEVGQRLDIRESLDAIRRR